MNEDYKMMYKESMKGERELLRQRGHLAHLMEDSTKIAKELNKINSQLIKSINKCQAGLEKRGKKK